MAERVAMLKAIWTETKPEFQGEFQSFEPMMTWPKPVQKPHPPHPGRWRHAPTLPAAPLPTVTAGFRWGVAAPTYWSNCLASARWRQRPGRDAESLPVSVFGASMDGDELKRFRDAGIQRVVFSLQSAKSEENSAGARSDHRAKSQPWVRLRTKGE